MLPKLSFKRKGIGLSVYFRRRTMYHLWIYTCKLSLRLTKQVKPSVTLNRGFSTTTLTITFLFIELQFADWSRD
jgi:hypothetical protein